MPGHASEAAVRRLPLYYRQLEELERRGTVRVSSGELAAQMGSTASQIRQDINFFGAFGQQGYGYNVSELKAHLAKILGLDASYTLVVAGVGNIGHAIVNYRGFADRGFRLTALFDSSAALIGSSINGVPVLDAAAMPAYLAENPTDIAVICTPAHAAQATADTLAAGGVRAIWNFAPVTLRVPRGVAVNNVHLTDSLLVLSYKLSHGEA